MKKKTDIHIEIVYIDPELCDRYDGGVFEARFSDVFKKTPAVKVFEARFDEKLDIELFTQFG